MRRYLIAMFVSLSALFWATGAAAAGETCPENMICASNPEAVAAELRDLGYRAKLTKHDSSGDPQIESAANGYDYVIDFNECVITVNCKSLGFVVTFEKDGANSAELANK